MVKVKRIAVTGGLLVGLAVVLFATATVISAIDYKLTEARGGAIGEPPIAADILTWCGPVAAAVGLALLLISVVMAFRAPGPASSDAQP